LAASKNPVKNFKFRNKSAILSMAKSCSSPGNACNVRISEKNKRARTVERTGVV
jgi:hypothetical protein